MYNNSIVSNAPGFVHRAAWWTALATVLCATIGPASADVAVLGWRKHNLFSNLANPEARTRIPPRIASRTRRTSAGALTARRRARTKLYRSKTRSRSRQRRKVLRRRPVRVASLGNAVNVVAGRSARRSAQPNSLTGHSRGVSWAASSRCLNGRLKSAIYHVARNFGRVRVNSTCRNRKKNRRAGGARRSYHLTGNAADIRIWGNVRGAARYLRAIAGGYKHYGGGLFHIDTGPRRRW